MAMVLAFDFVLLITLRSFFPEILVRRPGIYCL